MNGLLLTVFASFLSVVSLPVIIVGIIVAVIVVIGVIFLIRSGNKNKGTATGSSGDWQGQGQGQPGAWNQQAGWGQQGQWGAPNQAGQPGNWGAAPQQNPWGAPAQQQQAANPWGAPAQQQQQANPWGAPAQQQPAANLWEPAPAATTQDPWGQQQQQVAASQQPGWGISAPVQQGQQAPAAFGVSSPPAAAGWGQPQQADPWANQAASPVAQPNGFQAAGSSGPSWQQGSVGTQGGAGFAGNEPDKTMLRPGPAPQQSGIVGYVQVKEGKEPGRIYEIRKESLSIGRSRESDIFLEDLAVSRLHASIVNMGNGSYALKDEGSANGTKVNDQLVDKFKTYPLQEGDQIQLGQTILVFARH